MKTTLAPFVCAAYLLLTACSTIPKFEDVFDRQPIAPKVSNIADKIQCEILLAIDKGGPDPADKGGTDTAFAELQKNEYVANINLTLEVTDNQGFNPALSYINPLKTSGTNFTASLNAQLTGEQHRTINQTFTLVFDKNTPTKDKLSACLGMASHTSLKGNLGIAEILATGLKYETPTAYTIPALGVGSNTLSNDPLTGSAALAPNFGSTVDFTLVYGVNGGPEWTLVHFTGPSSANSGLLSYTRTDKDTLVISFAQVLPPTVLTRAPLGAAPVPGLPGPRVSPAAEAAARAAQDNVTRMILQRLLPR